jgi:hypothetical protein
MMDCLRHAVEYEMDGGVWGGLVIEERQAWAWMELAAAV